MNIMNRDGDGKWVKIVFLLSNGEEKTQYFTPTGNYPIKIIKAYTYNKDESDNEINVINLLPDYCHNNYKYKLKSLIKQAKDNEKNNKDNTETLNQIEKYIRKL